MKAKNLMIGDYISVKPSGMPIKVAAVHHKKVAYHTVINKLAWVRESLLEPIPLTPEILEKNGFERMPQTGCANPYYWMMEQYEEESGGLLYRIKAYNTPFRGMFVSIDNPSDCETISFGKQIESVHELQHALRLCAIKKEIEL